MAQVNFNVKMDENLKKEFDDFCENTGMSMTTAICMFAKKVVAEQKIPFEISANAPFYGSAYIGRLKNAIKGVDSEDITINDVIDLDDE